MEHIKIQTELATKIFAYHLYTVQIDFKRVDKNRYSFINELKRKGIALRSLHYVYRYICSLITGRDLNLKKEIILYLKVIIAKPFHYLYILKMSDSDIENVIASVRGVS